MLGDNDIEEIIDKKKVEKSNKDFFALINQLEKEKCICEKVYKEYGKTIKIRRIFARPKGSRNEYYQITYERDIKATDDYGVW